MNQATCKSLQANLVNIELKSIASRPSQAIEFESNIDKLDLLIRELIKKITYGCICHFNSKITYIIVIFLLFIKKK